MLARKVDGELGEGRLVSAYADSNTLEVVELVGENLDGGVLRCPTIARHGGGTGVPVGRRSFVSEAKLAKGRGVDTREFSFPGLGPLSTGGGRGKVCRAVLLPSGEALKATLAPSVERPEIRREVDTDTSSASSSA